MVRARFVLQTIKEMKWREEDAGSKTLVFQAQYDTTIPEQARFAKATPCGSLEMQVDNPAALEQFKLGKAYYLDFTPVDPAAEKAAG